MHKIWKRTGTIDLEKTIVKSGNHSIRMLPNTTGSILESPSFYAAVGSGTTSKITPSVWSYESAAYPGNRSRLIMKRNDSIGVSGDIVVTTRVGAADAAWEQMTGSIGPGGGGGFSEDGVAEFLVDCTGSATIGYTYIDSFTVT